MAPRFAFRAMLCLSLVARAAWGDGKDPVAAEALFAAGRLAFDQGDYDTACEKFAESQRLDPAPGTLTNLAACNEKRGRLASAWENWRAALSALALDDDRRPAVEKRLAEIEARLPRLDVRLAATAPEGTVVRRDGVALGAAALGVALPVDPGVHVVTAAADGRELGRFEASVEAGRVTTVVVEPGPALARAAESKPGAPTAPPAAEAAPAARPASGTRTLGLVLAGTGAAALVTGTVTGILALTKKGDIESSCTPSGDGYLCDEAGLSASRAGETFATVSSITIPVGLALGAVGAFLFFSAQDDPAAITASFGAERFSFAARGRF